MISEYPTGGLSKYSNIPFKEMIVKKTRLDLVRLCLSNIHRQRAKDESPRGRGQPKLDETILASLLGVHPKTTIRWHKKGYQACNLNTERLAQVAYELNPDETKQLLRDSYAEQGTILENWITDMNNRRGGCPSIRTEKVHRRDEDNGVGGKQ